MSDWIRIERARWEELDETARRLARISTNQKTELDECKRREAYHEATARSLDHMIRLRDEELATLRKDRADLWRALHRLHGTITDAIPYDEESELGQDIFAAAAVLDRTMPAPAGATPNAESVR